MSHNWVFRMASVLSLTLSLYLIVNLHERRNNSLSVVSTIFISITTMERELWLSFDASEQYEKLNSEPVSCCCFWIEQKTSTASTWWLINSAKYSELCYKALYNARSSLMLNFPPLEFSVLSRAVIVLVMRSLNAISLIQVWLSSSDEIRYADE